MNKKKSDHYQPMTEKELAVKTLQRYRPLLDPAEFNLLEEELEKLLIPAIRINSLKSDSQLFTQSLQKIYGWQLESIPFCLTGYRVNPEAQGLSAAIEHRMGFFYIQEAAAMLPAELFDYGKTNHPLILDLAASPGGKTTQLAEKTIDQNLIIANDASRTRLSALQIVLQNWGVINQAVTCLPGEQCGNWFPETFDMVLLDAPCSMEGLRTTASHPMRPITEKDWLNLSLRQQHLLESALKAACPGGQVVYSTCTLAPEENEAVLAAILKKFPGKFEISDVSYKLPAPAPGLTSDGKNKFPHAMQRSLRLWPHLFHTAGFFAAHLTKIDTLPTNKQDYPHIHSAHVEKRYLKEQEINALSNQMDALYGFALEDLLAKQNIQIWQRNEGIWLIPDLFLEHFSDLQAVISGMQMGKWVGSEIVLSHEFAARFGLQFQNGKIMLEDEFLPIWLRGEDLRGYNTKGMQKGIVIVVDKWGRNLGRGKVLSDRLKNLLPNRLF